MSSCKNIISILFTIILLFSLSGCALISETETFLKPPKLTEQHEKIYKALRNSNSSKISLKYPKTGKYLSPFVVANIDDEPTDEAVVFYEKTDLSGDEVSSLRFNILDQNNNEWYSIYDFSLNEANEIDRVYITKLGSYDKTAVIIGISNQTEKEARILFYDKESISSVHSLGSYSQMDICDLNNDGENELLLIDLKTSGKTAKLKWYNSDFVLTESLVLDLSEMDTETIQLLYGPSKPHNGETIIYADSFINTNTIHTEFLCLDKTSDSLKLKKLEPENSDEIDTVRPYSLASRDIDSDGFIEIPIYYVFKEDLNKPETEQMKLTNWFVYQNNKLIKKHSGYYNINDGYAFLFPDRWEDNVSVRIENNDAVFFFCSQNKQIELFRICTRTKDEKEMFISNNKNKYPHIDEIYSTGNIVYLACIAQQNEKNMAMLPSMTEISFGFKPIE